MKTHNYQKFLLNFVPNKLRTVIKSFKGQKAGIGPLIWSKMPLVKIDSQGLSGIEILEMRNSI